MAKTEIFQSSTTLDGSSVSFGDRLFLSSGLYFGYLYGQVRGDSSPPQLVVDAHPQMLAHLRDRDKGKHTEAHFATLSLQQLRQYERAVVEIAKPNDFASSSLSTTLVYGQTIRLKHVFSSLYVTLKGDDMLAGGSPRLMMDAGRQGSRTIDQATPQTPKKRDLDKGAKVELQEDLSAMHASERTDSSSSSQLFRILPKYSKIRKEGDAVRLGDQVIFQHFESGRVLASGEVQGKADCIDEVTAHRGMSEVIGLIAPKREITFSSVKRKESEIWMLHGFSKQREKAGPLPQSDPSASRAGSGEERALLRSGSVVALHHVESDCFLAVSPNTVPKPSWVGDLPVPLPAWPPGSDRRKAEERRCFVEPRSAMSAEFSSYASLWILERDEPHKGGVVQMYKSNSRASSSGGVLYKLRHLATDTYLSTEDSRLVTVSHSKEKQSRDCLIRFLPDSSTSAKQLDYSSQSLQVVGGHTLVRVQFIASKLLLHVRKNRETSLSNSIIYEDLFVVRPLNPSCAYDLCKVAAAAATLRICTSSNPKNKGDLRRVPSTHLESASGNASSSSPMSTRARLELSTVVDAALIVLESILKEVDGVINGGKVDQEDEENPVLCRQRLLLDCKVHVLCFSFLLWCNAVLHDGHDGTSPSVSSDEAEMYDDAGSPTGSRPEVYRVSHARRLCYSILLRLCYHDKSTNTSAAASLLSWVPLLSHIIGSERGKSQSELGLKVIMTILKGQPEGVTIKHQHMEMCLRNLMPFLSADQGTQLRVSAEPTRIAVLTCLCVAHGTGVKSHQNLICSAIRGSDSNFVYKTRMKKAGLQVLVPTGKQAKIPRMQTMPCGPKHSVRSGKTQMLERVTCEWVPLPRFMIQWPSASTAYFAATRELLYSLAYGNSDCARFARRRISVAEILEGVVLNNGTWTPPWSAQRTLYPTHAYSDPLKASYVRLCRASYIGRAPTVQPKTRRRSMVLSPLNAVTEATEDQVKSEWSEEPPRYRRRGAIYGTGVAHERVSFPSADVVAEGGAAIDYQLVASLLEETSLLSRMAETVLPVVVHHLTSMALLNPSVFRAGTSISDNPEGDMTKLYVVTTGDTRKIGSSENVKAPCILGVDTLVLSQEEDPSRFIATSDTRSYTLTPSDVFTVLRDAHEFHASAVRKALRAAAPRAAAHPVSTYPTVVFPLGAVLARRGEVMGRLLVVVHGSVQVDEDSNLDCIRGDHVGAAELLRREPSPATYVARTQVTCACITYDEVAPRYQASEATDASLAPGSQDSAGGALDEYKFGEDGEASTSSDEWTEDSRDECESELDGDPLDHPMWKWHRFALVNGMKTAFLQLIEEHPVVDCVDMALVVLQSEWLQLLSNFIDLEVYNDVELEGLMPKLATLLDPDTQVNTDDTPTSIEGYLFPHPLCDHGIDAAAGAATAKDDASGTINFVTAASLTLRSMRMQSLRPGDNSPTSHLMSHLNSTMRSMNNTVGSPRHATPHAMHGAGIDTPPPLIGQRPTNESAVVTRAMLEVCRIFMKLCTQERLSWGLSVRKASLPIGVAVKLVEGVVGGRSLPQAASQKVSIVDNLQTILLRVLMYEHGTHELFVTSFRLYLLISSKKENFPVTHPYARKGLVLQLRKELNESRRQEEREKPTVAKGFLYRLVEHYKSFNAGDVVGGFLTQKDESEALIAALGCLRDVIDTAGGDSAEDGTLVGRQNRLNALGAMRLVINTVGSSGKRGVHEDVVKEGLELAASLLDGGNAEVQHWLRDYFLSRRDEALFMVLRDRITKAIATIDKSVVEAEKAESDPLPSDPNPASPASETFCGPLYHIKETMRFLQLCSEGHNSELQNYFRVQEDNVHSHDLVRETLKFLTSLNSLARPSRQMRVSDFCLEVATQTWNTLTEFCQGPVPANQNTLIEGYIGNDVNKVFQIKGKTGLVEEMKNSAIVTMLSVVEGCTTPFAPLTLRCTLDLPLLLNSIYEIPESERDDTEFGYNLYLLLCFLRDYDVFDVGASHKVENVLDPDRQKDPRHRQALMHYRERTAQVEIMRDIGLERVYFRKPAACLRLTRRARKMVLERLSRETQQSRLVDFFDRVEETVFELEVIERIERTDADDKEVRARRFVHRWSPFVKRLGHCIVILANALLLFATAPGGSHPDALSFGGVLDMNVASTQMGATEIPLTIHIGLTFSVWILMLVIVFNLLEFAWFDGPVLMFTKLRDSSRKSGSKYSVSDYVTAKHSSHSWNQSRFATLNVMRRCLFTAAFLRLLLGFLACCFSLAVTPFAMSVLLIPLIAESAVIRHVFSAVTKNGKSLLLTFLFAVILMYLFSVVGFVLFREMFEGDEDGEAHCSTMFRCFVFTVTNGLRAGGGIGELIKSPAWGSPLHAVRLLYDMMFYIFVTVIIMNIVFGIIVDTFGELRQGREIRDQEMRIRCFICNVESADFDKRADGFTNHVQRDHNMWSYMFFAFYLTQKPKDDLTGQESYVLDCLSRNDFKFIPLNTSLALRNTKALEDQKSSKDADAAEEAGTSREDIEALGNRIESLEMKVATQYGVIEEHLSHLTRDKSKLEKRGMELWGSARTSVLHGKDAKASAKSRLRNIVKAGRERLQEASEQSSQPQQPQRGVSPQSPLTPVYPSAMALPPTTPGMTPYVGTHTRGTFGEGPERSSNLWQHTPGSDGLPARAPPGGVVLPTQSLGGSVSSNDDTGGAASPQAPARNQKMHGNDRRTSEPVCECNTHHGTPAHGVACLRITHPPHRCERVDSVAATIRWRILPKAHSSTIRLRCTSTHRLQASTTSNGMPSPPRCLCFPTRLRRLQE